MKKKIVSISGNDSSGGAGIAADIRTAYDIGVDILPIITATTSQGDSFSAGYSTNLKAQLDNITDDISAIKIGMIGSLQNAKDINNFLQSKKDIPVVIDPIISTSSGYNLMEKNTLNYLKRQIVSRGTIITPNKNEYKYFTDIECDILIKSYNTDTKYSYDKLVIGGESHEIKNRKHNFEMRGTGCMLATAIACYIALGHSKLDAVNLAIKYVASKFLLSANR